MTDEEYESVMSELYRQFNEEVTPIYVKLIKVRREIAELTGSETVAEYNYLNYFYREYSIEEVEKTYSDVKTYLVPLYKQLIEKSETQDLDSFYYESIRLGSEDMLYKIGDMITSRFPEMKYAYNHMTKFGFYDVAYSPNKMNVAYTDRKSVV